MAYANKAELPENLSETANSTAAEAVLEKLEDLKKEARAEAEKLITSDWHPSCGPFPTD